MWGGVEVVEIAVIREEVVLVEPEAERVTQTLSPTLASP